ncbi:hypothetical protein LCGC14_0701520 [marine sediment metagenome]|uniref:Uncharacterized protein n=1 Tax=marine sediment metagenome TaxID=412755 RepID=A0A0F9QMB8_9ZZZZ
MEQIQISAKVLGQVAMPDFCERCFWIKLHSKKIPWQIFPGIFSTIDAYTKKIVHQWIDRLMSSEIRDADCPQFLKDLSINGYMKVPHWSKFRTEIKEFGITLSGGADDLLTNPGGIHIPDYKTAKYTANQDKLYPMYRAQVQGYARIAEDLGLTVDSLSLIYMTPATDEPQVVINGRHPDIFKMTFLPHYLPVMLDIDSLDPLLERARKIYDGPMPVPEPKCKDCEALNDIMDLHANPNLP